ncbi:hypothetical protein CS062_00460 [Roseateles chitinivorans]|uniref:Uncharacterized protein n=1 Tax=Roseateles chitinivorans TaxID=2917965 RepID=A0A2G9CFD8_9BURK|nr:hypothetical protein [Roseateles chitinivorans]PIM55042.1 hypothetical protein CS062_00460 [Roseateles chitinivorans]
MKRALFTIVGALLFALGSYGLVELSASWYGPRHIRSDSDIGDAFMASLVFMAICSIVGGALGFMGATGRKA